jgi:hypothetical protein
MSLKEQPLSERVKARILSIDTYLDRYGYESFDPYDGLSSPLSKPFWRNQLLSRIWQQAVKLFPFNARPLLGIKKIAHTKAISDFASAYSLLYQATQEEAHRKKAIELLKLLQDISAPTTCGIGWGLRFPFATRFVKADATQVNIFQTINAIHSFLDGYEVFQDQRYLDIAQNGFRFLIHDLGIVEKGDSIYWKYWMGLSVEIFNVSGLMIGLCGRMGNLAKQEDYLILSRKLYTYIKSVQNPDGSWFYSADPKGHFIDGFHTGYILEGICLGIANGAIGRDEYLERGISYYLTHFFTDEGVPRYFHTSTYPIDGQNAAQALQTLKFVFNANFAEKKLLNRCFEQVDDLLWNNEGYYNYKKTKILTYRTPMHRWVTGPMFLALVQLSRVLK